MIIVFVVLVTMPLLCILILYSMHYHWFILIIIASCTSDAKIFYGIFKNESFHDNNNDGVNVTMTTPKLATAVTQTIISYGL